MGRRIGDDARQVRGAAVRRRTHATRGTRRLGQHAGALAGRLAGRQHRHRRGDRVPWARRPAARPCWARAAPRPPWSLGSPSLACSDISVVARNRDKAAPLLALGSRLGVDIGWVELGATVRGRRRGRQHASPPTSAARHADTVAATPLLLDAIYDPWPTPLAAAVEAAGGRVISGLQMLLHQAFAQVEQFTGLPAPTEAMRAALADQ